MRAKPSERLLTRLRAELGDELGSLLPPEAKIVRTYAGHWMLSAGAFRWLVEYPGSTQTVGSEYTVTELLKHKRIAVDGVWNDAAIVPASDFEKPTQDAREQK